MAINSINFKCKVSPNLTEAGVEIRITSSKGRGLFAAREIQKGDILFEESPIVGCQFAWNEDCGYLACNYCLRALETAEENARRLCQDSSINLPHLEQMSCWEIVRCECGVRYCSKNCQDLALAEYHASLCTALVQEKAVALQNLRDIWKNMQYPPETATIMLIIRLYAYVHQASNKEIMMGQFNEFIPEMVIPGGVILQKLLGEQFKDKIELLTDAVRNCIQILGLEIPPEWQTSDDLVTKLAMIAANNQGIGTSAFGQWVSKIDELSLSQDEQNYVDDIIGNLYNKMEEVVGLEFLNNEGSGLYALQSKINHSCDANVEVTFTNGNHTLAVRALKNIAPGEEICSSYLDECALARSRHSRQAILSKDYSFLCLCTKCEDQAADPDETSEEEDEDEDMSC